MVARPRSAPEMASRTVGLEDASGPKSSYTPPRASTTTRSQPAWIRRARLSASGASASSENGYRFGGTLPHRAPSAPSPPASPVPLRSWPANSRTSRRCRCRLARAGNPPRAHRARSGVPPSGKPLCGAGSPRMRFGRGRPAPGSSRAIRFLSAKQAGCSTDLHQGEWGGESPERCRLCHLRRQEDQYPGPPPCPHHPSSLLRLEVTPIGVVRPVS